MKIFLPTYDRAGNVSTTSVLGDSLDWCLLVHNDEELRSYLEAENPPDRVLLTGEKPGFSGQYRQKAWAMEHIVAEGEWACFMDDDIERFECLESKRYGKERVGALDNDVWRARFSEELSPESLLSRMEELRDRAEDTGANYAGFCGWANQPDMRRAKWSEVGFVLGGFCLWRKTPDFPYDTATHVEDIYLSCEHLKRDGRVLVNQHVSTVHGQDSNPGGYQSMADRRQARLDSLRFLLRRYPGMLRVVPERDEGWGTHRVVELGLGTLEEVEDWIARTAQKAPLW